MLAAARLPPRRLPANSQFDLPMAIGRMWFSTQLFEIGTSPSSTKRVNCVQRSKLKPMVFFVAGGTQHHLALREQPAVQDGQHPVRLALAFSPSLTAGQIFDLSRDLPNEFDQIGARAGSVVATTLAHR